MEKDLEKTTDLVELAKNGDTTAMNRLFARYQDRILNIVRLRLGKELRAKLETVDIGQEVMLKAMNGIQGFKMSSEGDFIHWLSKLIENTIRDKSDYFQAEKRSVRDEVPLELLKKRAESTTQNFTFPGKDPTPSAILRGQEELRLLEDAMAKLGEVEREVIIMCDYEELTYQQVGEKINKTQDAVRMLHKRAVAKLMTILQEEKSID